MWFVGVGDSVLAEWKDERYYLATVMSVANQASGSIQVKFADDSIMTVEPRSLVKCGHIPVGCTVLARADETTAWYEPAVIQSHYTDDRSVLQGYIVQFTGHTYHTRSAVLLQYCFQHRC